MNSFKDIVGIAPNAPTKYVSKLYPGLISDKAIMQGSGLLKHFVVEDILLADKGFLIDDLVPNGASVIIPPFRGKFTEWSKSDKVNCTMPHASHTSQILSFNPSYLICHADNLFQLCAALWTCSLFSLRTAVKAQILIAYIYKMQYAIRIGTSKFHFK